MTSILVWISVISFLFSKTRFYLWLLVITHQLGTRLNVSYFRPGYPMMVGYPMLAPPQLAHVGPLLMPGTGSIRSVQSVPMLSHGHHTWDGEPCPVHHQHPMVPLAALYGKI